MSCSRRSKDSNGGRMGSTRGEKEELIRERMECISSTSVSGFRGILSTRLAFTVFGCMAFQCQ